MTLSTNRIPRGNDTRELTPGGGRRVSAFERDCLEHVGALRAALQAACESAGLGPAPEPTRLDQILQIRGKLAWRVSKFLAATSARSATGYLPTGANVDRMLATMASRGLGESHAERVRSAMQRVDNLVREHAGDRATFEAMIRHWTVQPAEAADLEHARAAFRAGARLVGLSTKLHVLTHIPSPTAQADQFESTAIASYAGLVQHYPTGVPIYFRMNGLVEDDGEPVLGARTEALDPEQTGPWPLISRYCSPGASRLEQTTAGRGIARLTLPEDMIGRTEALQIAGGVRMIGARPAMGEPDMDHAGYWTFAHIPIETLVLDVLLHPGMYRDVMPKGTAWFVRAPSAFPIEHPENRRSAVCEALPVVHSTRGIGTASLEDMPDYPEVVRFACERIGVDADLLELYRCVVHYPALMSHVVLDWRFPVP